ncbi:uncharacterized protein RJT20DRAFT_34865 [Scheffersomyces xylosifermentans]|uniref:uncharacterized protein n=1 Tax=Scheffersomyces xylosifermentans TaxID=1304137 RepID=UPI00315D2852
MNSAGRKTTSDDEVEEDVLGNNKRYKQRHRNDLRLNYDSDSSVEDYKKQNDAIESKNGISSDSKKQSDDEDDDMFASDNDEEEGMDGDDVPKNATSTNTKKNDTQFLDIEEFSRQEGIGKYDEERQLGLSASQSGEDDEEDEDDPDLDYYNNIENLDSDAIKRKNKKDPKMEAFDLRDEADEGRFDKDGNFIRQEEDDLTDAEEEWLNDYKKSDVKNAKKAQEMRERIEEKKLMDKSNDIMPIHELLTGLIDLLEVAETPMEALARLAPRKKNKKLSKNGIDSDAEKLRKETVIKITDFCDKLINDKYLNDTYDLSKEELMRIYKQETGVEFQQHARGLKRSRDDEDPEDIEQDTLKKDIDYGEKIWEFKWVGEEEVNGPYSSYEMEHWKETYFNNNVEVRKTGTSEFFPVDSIKFQ